MSQSGTYPTASSLGAFNAVETQVFTTSGVYTPTAGMAYCIVEVIGGGSGAGGVGAAGAGAQGASAGGGAGGYTRRLFSAAEIGASQTVTIGAGGAGGTSAPTNGFNGGITFFGAFMSASPGATTSGVTPAAGNLATNGAAGGPSTGGDFNMTGGSGGPGFSFATGSGSIGVAGEGGSSAYGGGPPAPARVPSTGGFPGSSANSFGAGGTGAVVLAGEGGRSGGNGRAGIVIITEFIST